MIHCRNLYSSKISRNTTVNSTKLRNPSPSVSPLLMRSTAASCVRISPNDAIEVLKWWLRIILIIVLLTAFRCWQPASKKRQRHHSVWTSWIWSRNQINPIKNLKAKVMSFYARQRVWNNNPRHLALAKLVTQVGIIKE